MSTRSLSIPTNTDCSPTAGCGCVLFRDPAVGRFYKHGSPYTYFSSAELHLGEISLECSRPGASAVALWATQQLYPLEKGGQLAAWLDDCLTAARDLTARLAQSEHFVPLLSPELDIVVYCVDAEDTQTTNRRARTVFEIAAAKGLHLALAEFPVSFLRSVNPDIEVNSETVTCLRSVLMKPEHRDWIDDIVAILDECAAAT